MDSGAIDGQRQGRWRTTAAEDSGGGGIYDILRGIRRRTYGCHFHEFPCMRTQALLALCTLTGIQFPGNNNLGRGEKG